MTRTMRTRALWVIALFLALPLVAKAATREPATGAALRVATEDSTGSTPPPATTEHSSHMAPGGTSGARPMMHVDLNAASKEDLMKLPGITDALAEKIISSRPFQSRSELLTKKILTKAEYSKIRAHVMVKGEKASSGKSSSGKKEKSSMQKPASGK